MISSERWKENLRVVGPHDARVVHLAWFRPARDASPGWVRELPDGTPVVLVAQAPAARLRCRLFAARAGIDLEREYLAFPSARAPAYLVESSAAPVRLFLRSILVSPPGATLRLPLQIGMSLLRAVNNWRLVRAIAPGRVVVGRRACQS